MSGKLDQSLDEIVSTQRRVGGGGRGGRPQRRSVGRAAKAAPVGGVQKTPKLTRAAAAKQNTAKAAGGNGESKVVVSNLPKDVNEGQIKEYFATSVGPIKRVELSYGPNSISRGIATVTFSKLDGASKAFNALNGLLVDNRPIKIEIVVSAAKAAEIAPPAKTLTERITQPKAQPKSAANDKKKEAAGKAVGSGARGRKRRGGPRSGRPAKKTAEELDEEMADYFEAGNQNENANGNAPAATNGDAPMEDEILVCASVE
ncbi:RNA recognition domain-containing protein [Annulohypoxylon truncatum]|uniref:RNA recognition domain-containing protein n=1 Tax=Annulohypoxylon truncatum TaxID=327061 RepID=UPI002008848D|nr:RNA recognition domain-containing protein [Annulohypoxylon truncatum]KAI1210279.1 RNA recognition domain-containing protein [Annulohypoxylon truncatum]